MSENTQTPQPEKTIQLKVEITEHFAKFLKDYLAFFGSHMTIETLLAQMINSETSYLHQEVTAYLRGENHYVGLHDWLLKYPHFPDIIEEEEQANK
jgi:hypothetical protein